MRTQPARISNVFEESAADISIKRVSLVGKRGDEDIIQPVVVNVTKIRTHAGERASILIESDTRLQAHFTKFQAAFIVKQEVGRRVVRNE